MAVARIPGAVAPNLYRGVQALGAIHAHELQQSDWLSLPSWAALKELECRRVLNALRNAVG